MSEMHEDEVGALLQQGLRDAPVPVAAADFNDKVRARLRRPEPWWQTWLNAIRPIAAPAACSLAVTLALLIVMASPKPEGSHGAGAQGGSNVALDPGVRSRSIEQDMERLDNDIPSLSGFRRARRSDARDDARREPPMPHRGTSERLLELGNRV